MKLRYCLILSACILALAGCQNNFPKNETAAFENETVSQTGLDLKKLTDLIGKSDDEVTAVLGPGEEMKNEEGAITERNYTISLLDEDASVSLSFNLSRDGVNLLEKEVIHLGQSGLDEYAENLKALFGEPTETYEKSYFFSFFDKTLVLADPYDDGAYIEISAEE